MLKIGTSLAINKKSILSSYNLKSKSSILDSFQKTLNPIIWEGPAMKEEFKAKVLQQVMAFISEYALELKGVLIYGGNAGYQYGPLSDTDISVYIDWDKADPEKYEELAEALRGRKFVYSDGLEVHFMLKSPSEKELVEANENVYNILGNKWIQEPTKYDFEPRDEFAGAIDKANIFKRLLQERYDEVQTEIKDLKEAGVLVIPDEALSELKKLVGIVAQVRKNRDLEHIAMRKKAVAGEKITIFDRATDNEFVWKTIADLPMTHILKKMEYKEKVAASVSSDLVKTLKKGMSVYHCTNGDKSIISTQDVRLIPNSISYAKNKLKVYGENCFKAEIPSGTKYIDINDETFYSFGKETDTPINRGKLIKKLADESNAGFVKISLKGHTTEYAIIDDSLLGETTADIKYGDIRDSWITEKHPVNNK